MQQKTPSSPQTSTIFPNACYSPKPRVASLNPAVVLKYIKSFGASQEDAQDRDKWRMK